MKRAKPPLSQFVIPPHKVVSVGVDWLTCTQFRATDDCPLKAEIERVIYKERELGNDDLKWRGQGYYGHRSGGAAVGVREDTYLAILTSDCARKNWRSVGLWATNCSRIDVQITLELEEKDPTLFDRLEAHLCFLPPRRGRPIGVCRVRDNKGGNTLYVGSRQSDWYMRIYDKGIESKTADAGKLIRIEVERKRRPAKQLLNDLVFDDDPESRIYNLMLSDLKKLLVAVGAHDNWSLEVARVESFTDSKRRLAYLAASVRPIIEKLISSGYGVEAKEILFHNTVVGDTFSLAETKPYWRT
jgi:Replication initiation factor